MDSKKVLKELYVGIGIHLIFFLVLGMILIDAKLRFLCGIIIGALCAMVVSHNMYKSLDIGLELPPKDARNYVRKRSIFRLVFMLVVLVVSVIIDNTVFLGTIVGLLGLKTSAFLNPIIKNKI